MKLKAIAVILLILISGSVLAAQNYVFFGDSITDGAWGASGGRAIPAAQRKLGDLNHIYGHSYVMLIASDWQASYSRERMNFYNRGMSGDTLEGLMSRWRDDVLPLRPDVLTILVGVNDSAGNIDVSAWEQKYREMLNAIRKELPDCKFALGTPFMAPFGRFGTAQGYNERSERVRKQAAAVRELAAEFHAVLLDFDVMFDGLVADALGGDGSWWIWDGIHPTAAGHRKMADLWEEKLGVQKPVQAVIPPTSSPEVNSEESPARVTIKLPGGKAPEAPAGPFEASWESLEANYRVPEWFKDAKFGIFMHWGLYSVPAAGSEWYPKHMYNGMLKHHTEHWGKPSEFGYKDFIPLFKAEHFNPEEWAALFEEAGARYAVLTAEHHDGFAMYDSDLTEWDVVDKGPKRDLLGDLAKAVRGRNIKFGISNHRIENWDFMYPAGTKEHDLFDPRYAGLYGPPQKPSEVGSAMGAGKDAQGNPAHPQSDEFLEEWLARAQEIVDKYHQDLYFFDNGVNSRSLDPWKLRFAKYYYNSAAHWGKEVSLQTKSDAYLYGTIKDYERQGRAPKDIENVYWQVDEPIGHKFGYVEGLKLQTSATVVNSLVENISKGGNLCLNISPKADGTIPQDQQKVLREVGAWLKVNGEAVYGSRTWKVYGEDKSWRFTSKGEKTVYAFAMGDQTPVIKSLASGKVKVRRVEMLGGKGRIKFSQDSEGLLIEAPVASLALDKDMPRIRVFKISL